MTKERRTIIVLSALLGGSIGANFSMFKSHRQLLQTARELYSVAMTNDKQNDYLRDLLVKHEVPISEFDILAMNALKEDG